MIGHQVRPTVLTYPVAALDGHQVRQTGVTGQPTGVLERNVASPVAALDGHQVRQTGVTGQPTGVLERNVASPVAALDGMIRHQVRPTVLTYQSSRNGMREDWYGGLPVRRNLPSPAIGMVTILAPRIPRIAAPMEAEVSDRFRRHEQMGWEEPTSRLSSQILENGISLQRSLRSRSDSKFRCASRPSGRVGSRSGT